MKLVVGLGNPGKKYESTRHNVGFLVVDELCRQWQAGPPQKRFEGELFEATLDGLTEKILLIKPQTFMNLSGKCVGEIMRFYKCSAQDLVVIHDELDLEPFRIQIKKGGGAAGNKGVLSILSSLDSEQQDFIRVRVGIGKPNFPLPIEDWVLKSFSSEEKKIFQNLIPDFLKMSELLVRGEIQKAMNQFNRRNKKEES